MADVSNLKIGNISYTIKDTIARTQSSNADTKSDQAIQDSSQALNTANSALSSSSSANTKIDGAEITGTYTSATETLDISLTLGS